MNKNDLNIVYFGTPNFAVPALKLLVENGYKISAVFTGQGPVSALAQEHKIKILRPTSLKKDEQVFEEFKSLNPDLCIVAAYGKIIPQNFLDIPRYGFINIHPSLLPKYRGPSPIQTAILNRDTKTGVSIMLIDAEVDHGPLLGQTTHDLQSDIYYNEAEKELAETGAKLLLETLPKYLDGELEPKEQNHGQATFTKILGREDGKINWSEPSEKICAHIRALNPEPGTWTIWKDKVINIKKAELRDGKIAIQTIQMEGKKEMPFEEFLRGHQDFDISQLK